MSPTQSSYALDSLCPLVVELIGVASVGLLLAVFQTGAGVSFQHSVLGAEVAFAEAAVTDDSLGCLLAFFEVATWLARGHGEDVGGEGARCCGGSGSKGRRGCRS